MRKIDKVIIHCTATPEGRQVSLDTIRDWHVVGNGWSDIGYHFIVHQFGHVELGRDLERSGAHTKGHNKHSIGVCYVGGVDSKMKPKDTRTENQAEALRYLVMDLLEQYPGSTVHGHNEFSNKACPSFNVSEDMADIIEYYINEENGY